MKIRAATPEDADAITKLETMVFGDQAWSPTLMLAELSQVDRVVVVASAGTSLLGYAITLRSADVVDLHRIAVHPDHRRTGIAGALLAASIQRARSEHADRMLLEVGYGNAAARRFYESKGFVQLDLRRGYYVDGSDALVLERSL